MVAALQIFAGPRARAHLQQHGLQPTDVCTIPAAAGGPKGLLLGRMDQFLFGEWLAGSTHPVDLVGASIGAWRMSTACLNDPVAAFARLEHDYIHQHYALPPGQKRVSATQVSETFGRSLEAFYGGRIGEVLAHPRYRLHVVTSRGRGLLRRQHAWNTPLGYFGAFLTNTAHRKAMGAWLERVVFSTPDHSTHSAMPMPLPFATNDYRTRHIGLNAQNFNAALQASCSIPFVLNAVHDIPGAPPGAYWDGGITDYHLHLNYPGATRPPGRSPSSGEIVLYPHFQQSVIPGWLDKSLRWRHGASHFLDTMVLLAPHPDWVKTLPNGKLPDRTDFTRYGNDLAARVKAWSTATQASAQLVDEFAAWLEKPDMTQVLPL